MIMINIPIEPIDARYSIQWDGWFRQGFSSAGIPLVINTYGPATSGTITNGSFLDIVETNIYKTRQLSEVLEQVAALITNKDEHVVLFFHDLWYPGLETIAYIRDGFGLTNLQICGCLHAGTYDPYDFLAKSGMSPWASAMEYGWFARIADLIFVATDFHRKLLHEQRRVPLAKIVVTGFPIYPDFVEQKEKEKLVVFPHRLDSEKQPDLFDKMAGLLAREGWKFVKTKEVATTKAEYYEVLNRASVAVSFANQETWGIAMQEAALCGAVPIVPNRLSYKEMYWDELRYDTFEEACQLVSDYMDDPQRHCDSLQMQKEFLIKKGAAAIPNIVEQITRRWS